MKQLLPDLFKAVRLLLPALLVPVIARSQYCTPTNNNCGGEGITNVTFGTLNNTTSSCSPGGYTNYTTTLPAPTIFSGTGTAISLGLKVNSSGGAAIWIDYNHSNSFTADECTLIAPVSGTNVTVSTTIAVPAVALNGTTRMRIRETYGASGFPGSHNVAATSSCLSNDYTEFEDYLVNIQPFAACSGTPVAGTTLSSSNNQCPGTNFTLSLTGTSSVNGLGYQWFSSPAGAATFAPVSGATNPTLTTSQTANRDYYCRVTCTNSGLWANSTTLAVTSGPFYNCYCTPSYANGCSGDNIASVTLGALNESGLGCMGYTDRTSLQSGASPSLPVPLLFAGMNNTLTLTFGGDPNQFSGAWIDLDHNGVFNAGEYFSAGSNAGANGTANIVLAIPATALAGRTRIRIRGGDDNALGNSQACGASNSSYGTARDYLVDIQAFSACSGTPVAGTTSSTSNSACPGASFTLSLTGSTSGVGGLSYQWYSSPAGTTAFAPVSGATNATLTTSLAASTDYYCQVTCANGGQSASSTVHTVLANPFYNCYCTPSYDYGSCDLEDHITSVTLDVLNETGLSCSSAPGYVDRAPLQTGANPSLPVPVILSGTNNTLTLTFGADNEQYSAAWIDMNHNGVFDTGEYFSTGSNAGANGTANIVLAIPATALTGQTRMRIRGGDNLLPDNSQACGASNSDVGMARDYLVDIQAAPSCNGQPVAGATSSTANSSCPGTSFTLSLTGSTSGVAGLSYQWYSSPAGTTAFAPVSGATDAILTTSLTASTDYYCQVTCANGGQSDSSTVLTVLVSPFYNCYCTPTYDYGSCDYEDQITAVTLGALNETGISCVNDPGYVDQTSLQTGANPSLPVPVILAGANNTLTLTFGADNEQYSAAWIDLDHNGVFDAGEYFSTGSNAGANGTDHIMLAIPGTALTGQTRMRIRGGDNFPLDNSLACEYANSNYGMARDYLVDIVQVTAPPSCVAVPVAPANGSGMCISATGTTLSWPAVDSAFNYDVYLDQAGATTLAATVSGTSYTTTAPLAAGSYSWKVVPKNMIGSATGCSIFTFTVNPPPAVSVTSPSGITCASTQLSASGANTYTWSPASGLSATTGASVTASPTATTTYTVTGTDNNGCSNTATTTITPIGAVTPSAPSQTQCNGPATIAVTPISPLSGSMEYELTDTLGNVVAGWQSAATFTVTPSQTGRNKYFLFARNTNCPADLSDTGTAIVFSGFSAIVTGNNASCANGDGSLVISNPQGPGAFSSGTWYSNDFSTTALDPLAITLYGAAGINANALQLTPNMTSQDGGLLVKNPQGISQNVDSVKFTLSVPQFGADGISWSFADNIVYSSSSELESGAGNKLILTFDAYGSSDPGKAGIYLKYGQQGGVAVSSVVTPTMLAYSANTSSWRGQSGRQVAIYITPAGKLTLKVGTTTIFNQVQLPAAYVNANRSSWQHLFAARTGGVSEQHVIDNLNIYYSGATFVYGATPAHSSTAPTSWQSSGSFGNLTGGDSLDLWIANPDAPVSCNQKLGTYAVSAPVVATFLDHGAPSCTGASDGYIAIGVNAPGTYSATYSKDGGAPVTQTGLTTQNNGAIDFVAIADMATGSYSNLKIVSAANCNANVIPLVTLPDPGMTSIAGSSFTATATQGNPGLQYYTDDACGAIAAINSNNNLGNVSASVTIGGPISAASGEPFLGRHYEITPGQNAGMPVRLTLYFTQDDFDQYNASSLVGTADYPAIDAGGTNLRIRAYHGLPSSGTTGPNGTYDAANADLIAPSAIVFNSNGFWEVTFLSPNGFSGFFANTNTSTPLYLELGELSAAREGTINRLRWNTLKEKAGDRFEIERSNDARSFSKIGSMPARGLAPANYTFTDEQALPGTNFYRLRLMHTDGDPTYSKVVQVSAKDDGFVFDVYPNPAKETLCIKLSEVKSSGVLTLKDITGRTIMEQTIAQTLSVTLDMTRLATGVYWVQYKDEVHTASVKISKQ